MAEIVHLQPGETFLPNADRWIIIEADGTGQFFGSGESRLPSGDTIFYASLSENDYSLEAAIATAQAWATIRDVPTIYVQTDTIA